jgi:hypothetical protein
VQKLCLFCAKPFWTLSTGNAQKYCTREHQAEAKRILRARRVAELRLSWPDPDQIGLNDPHIVCDSPGCRAHVYHGYCESHLDALLGTVEPDHFEVPSANSGESDSTFKFDTGYTFAAVPETRETRRRAGMNARAESE